jgi:transglutaminase-like putative cysteine protease
MAIFKIHHITKYAYDRPVKESNNEIKIFPFNCLEQELLDQELNISGNPDVQTFTDYWGNKTGSFNILGLHKELVIESKLTIRATLSSQLRFNFHIDWNELHNAVENNLQLLELAAIDKIVSQEKIVEIVTAINAQNKSVTATIEASCEYVYKHFQYIKGITTIETTLDEILMVRAGVCQDFAILLLQILRTLKIPSRYVSGYICPNKNGMRGEGATHAWVDAFIPGYGWAGIDPTNNIWVTNHHIKLAVGKGFKECSPIKGSFKGPAKQALSVFVSVGYEDGQTFEEINNVQMQIAPKDKEALLLEEMIAQQQ